MVGRTGPSGRGVGLGSSLSFLWDVQGGVCVLWGPALSLCMLSGTPRAGGWLWHCNPQMAGEGMFGRGSGIRPAGSWQEGWWGVLVGGPQAPPGPAWLQRPRRGASPATSLEHGGLGFLHLLRPSPLGHPHPPWKHLELTPWGLHSPGVPSVQSSCCPGAPHALVPLQEPGRPLRLGATGTMLTALPQVQMPPTHREMGEGSLLLGWGKAASFHVGSSYRPLKKAT